MRLLRHLLRRLRCRHIYRIGRVTVVAPSDAEAIELLRWVRSVGW